MTIQTAVRLPDQLVEGIDALVAAGRFGSRTDAVRAAVAALLDAEHRRRVDAQIVEAYTREPQTEEDDAWALANLERSVREEPW